MEFFILSFIGIALNIWTDIGGDDGLVSRGLKDAQGNFIFNAQNVLLVDAQNG